MKLPVLNVEGKELRQLDVDESVFGIEPNAAVLHQAFVTGRNNRRSGTVQTKTRGMVQGSTRKIRRQKYTGRARQGSIRAPHHVGGGTVFGPHPRSYSQALPKKMRRLAIRSALSGKAADGELVVVDRLAFKIPKTKEMRRLLVNVGIERSALIVTGQPDRTVLMSVRNLAKTKVLAASYLNVVDMLNHQKLLMTEEAVRVVQGLWGRKKTAAAQPAVEVQAKRRRAVKAAAEVAAPAAGGEIAATVTPAPKTRGRRSAASKAPAVEEKRRQWTRPKGEGAGEAKPPARARKVVPEASAGELAGGAPKPRVRRAKRSNEGQG